MWAQTHSQGGTSTFYTTDTWKQTAPNCWPTRLFSGQTCHKTVTFLQHFQSPPPKATPYQSPSPFLSLGNCEYRIYLTGNTHTQDGLRQSHQGLIMISHWEDAMSFHSPWHPRKSPDRQWQTVCKPQISTVCRRLELCSCHEQPML